ncbi:MAG: glycosyltransferase family 4 protein [Bacteroides sp.]|nr:glycosyltransferase family 4 protein [Prevotella sp.]MCM1408567.1 glycosyltransferase family 4 protein [Treponema brennaborense]MCM1468944.1 glycosyltransferase family 4 protein [Bacteroides sp.]
MKVLFDHQIFSYQEYGGVSRYFCKLFENLPREMWNISLLLSNNYYLEENRNLNISYHNFFKKYHFYRKERLMLELGKIYSSKCIRNENYDVLHLSHYESYACSLTRRPIVITYMDALFSSYAFNARTVREQKKCFDRVDSVIAISNSTKRDLLELFDYPAEKVKVIYLGVDDNIKKQEPIISGSYILFVGRRSGYKNFDLFLDAFSRIRDIDLKLVCAGPPFTKEEVIHIEHLGLQKRVIQKLVSDNELNALYQHALFFIFPSKYEGFGLPLLEAMVNKCPVLCSNTSSLPEVAGNAAIYFNPNDLDSIEYAMLQVINSSDLRNNLVSKGEDRIKLFTWEKCAKEHISLYKSLL